MTNATLDNYNKLAAQHANTLGMQLPTLTSAALTLRAKQASLSDVHREIQDFAEKYGINAGWAMLSDTLLLTKEAPNSEALLQAQYTDGNNSLHIQHLGQNLYQMTWFLLSDNEDTHDNDNNEDTHYCYREQKLVLRPNLDKSHSLVRFWFKEIDHRWQPIAQQFVGLMNLAKG